MPSKDKSKSRRGGLSERLALRSRTVFIFGAIEPKLTRDVVRQLLMLEHISDTKGIRVFINSPGGVADDGFAIFDVLRFIKAPVTTVVTGLAASAATILMCGAPKERRFVLPSSRIMLHQPSVGIQGTAADIEISAKEIVRLRQKANELFASETGKPIEQIVEDQHRDFWLNAQEAVDYGLLSKVVTSMDDLPE